MQSDNWHGADHKSALVQVIAWSIRQEAITWVSVEPAMGPHMMSLGHSVLSNLLKLFVLWLKHEIRRAVHAGLSAFSRWAHIYFMWNIRDVPMIYGKK